MKLTQTFHALITPFLGKQQLGTDFFQKSFLTVCLLTIIAFAVWFLGPHLILNGNVLLNTPERRIYTILFVFLLWLLKFLLIDLESSNIPKNPSKSQKRIQELQNRFYGALRFLKKTTVKRQNQTIHLNQLPWYLILGPVSAGKTTLLANSGVNFILQRQFNHGLEEIEASENCDWWITNQACLIDIPSQYLTKSNQLRHKNEPDNSYLFQNLLQLIKKNRGKNALSGIIIALPLPEMARQGDPKKYNRTLQNLFERLHDLQKHFPRSIPCQLIITKCDLLPGFNEFFAESSHDEIGQTFGVPLYDVKKNLKTYEVFSDRFNTMIKKLNQQLLWRLHQERNPLLRPYIKDFPLQIDRTKEFILDFIKKFSAADFNMQLQGVYLTSALQAKPETSNTIVDENINVKERAIQLFKEPLTKSRAYFIKHLLTHGLVSIHKEETSSKEVDVWTRRFSYAASIAAIISASIWLLKDFKQGVQQTSVIQNEIAEYQLVSHQFHNPDELLESTIKMLNTLEKSSKKPEFKLDFAHLFAFYSQKSQQNAALAYQQALQYVLLPVVKTYFEEYLKNPVNKNTESVYGVLKAYVMLGDKNHYQPDYIIATLKQILPKSLEQSDISGLTDHLSRALNLYWGPIALDANSLEATRRFLISMPSDKLGYIILKNIDDNNNQVEINFGLNSSTVSVFSNKQFSPIIPNMFTGRLFPSILSQQTIVAAQEAVNGNWILGTNVITNKAPEFLNALTEQLRATYINHYISKWEGLIGNIRVATPNNLKETDILLVTLLNSDSPLLQILQTLRENTYFEPIVSSSPKLQNLTALINKSNSPEDLLYQIFACLQNLHEYLQNILTAENEKKAAFNASINIMQHNSNPDPITQLRTIAATTPEPLKTWLNSIANHAWFFLMQDANHYLDISWQEKVIRVYLAEIADRYPFTTGTRNEVDLQKFTEFFGTSGIMTSFYRQYLEPFIDTSTPDWHWKTVDSYKLPFSQEKLRQIQHAMRIHSTFFPNNDNKLNIHFALQPYHFGKSIKKVKVNVANTEFVDLSANSKNTHLFVWPSNEPAKVISVQLLMMNNQMIQHKYVGEWGWFKLINQSYESTLTRKEILLNFSFNQNAAKYVLSTNEKINPLLSLNLHHFHLPEQLSDQTV